MPQPSQWETAEPVSSSPGDWGSEAWFFLLGEVQVKYYVSLGPHALSWAMDPRGPLKQHTPLSEDRKGQEDE